MNMTSPIRDNKIQMGPGRPQEESPDMEREQLRKVTAMADKYEIDNKLRLAHLVDTEVVKQGRIERIQAVKKLFAQKVQAWSIQLDSLSLPERIKFLEAGFAEICAEFSR